MKERRIPTRQPSKIRRKATAASPSLMLFGHDEPDDGASGQPVSYPRTRDQRTTVRKKNVNNTERGRLGVVSNEY